MSDPYKHNGAKRPIGRATHHIIVELERLVLACEPVANKPPELDEIGAGAQCEGCGRDIFEGLKWDAAKERFVCECEAEYKLLAGGYLGLPEDDEEDDR
jgi:hypothetical protein